MIKTSTMHCADASVLCAVAGSARRPLSNGESLAVTSSVTVKWVHVAW